MPCRRYAFVVLLVLALGTLAGCPFITKGGDDKPNPEPPVYPEPTTIGIVLQNLQKSYIEMNIDQYEKLFDPSYTYIFSPQDIGDGNPESWGLSDEIVSARHMFSKTDANLDGNIAEKVRLTFDIGPEIPNDLEDWTKVILSNVYLTLETRSAQTGDNTNYEVQGDQAYLWFKKVGGYWKIVQWEDRPIAKKLLAKN